MIGGYCWVVVWIFDDVFVIVLNWFNIIDFDFESVIILVSFDFKDWID